MATKHDIKVEDFSENGLEYVEVSGPTVKYTICKHKSGGWSVGRYGFSRRTECTTYPEALGFSVYSILIYEKD